MATRFQTILAEATWLRMGGRECFLKAMKVASLDASAQTAEVVGQSRLNRIQTRVNEARVRGAPLVEIFHAGFIGEREFFLLCMEKVTPLHMYNGNQAARIKLAQQIILKLCPPATGYSWHHYDVCLRNLGATQEGKAVFIDPDSLYLVPDDFVYISTPIGKDWRLPKILQEAVVRELQANELKMSRATAAIKQRFDLLLAAAELTLEHEIPGSRYAADEWLPEWLDSAPDRQLVDFWRPLLLPALEDPTSIDLTSVVDKLRCFSGSSLDSRSVPPNSKVEVSSDEIAVLGRKMRNDRLERTELHHYRRILQEHLRGSPLDILAWRELRLLCIGYLQDLESAAEEVDNALKYFPNDSRLRRWREVLLAWGSFGGPN